MRALLALPAILLAAAPADAEIVSNADAGFAVAASTTLARDRDMVWAVLIQPAKWWSSDHTYSHDAANLSLVPRAGGCFCETLPGKPGGSVQHMTVVYVKTGEMLRMTGALGPLQGEGLSGSLTVELKPAANGGTTIGFTYVVGGYSRLPLKQVAPAVDKVLTEQLARLASAANSR